MSEVIDQHRLADYLAKRTKWLSWYETGAGESNSLQDQWFAMLLSEMSFRVVREEGAKDPTSMLNVPLVVHLLNSGYFSSQVLATRRLLDSRNDVISLRRLIDDIRENRDLITREVYVSFDGAAYAPELPELAFPGLQPAESPFSEWNKSQVRQERFDKLSKVLPENRARDNKIHESVFSKMDNWINSSGASKLITLSHKYLAHAAQQSSISTAIPKGLSFAEVEGIQKAVVQSMRVIYDIILSSGIYSEVVPMVPLACIIRERPASDDFAWHKIAWEDEGSVKLLCGTWRQALQAYTIKAATILGRGFPLLSVGSGENGNSSGERCRFTQLMLQVPSPCAGRSPETGTIAASV